MKNFKFYRSVPVGWISEAKGEGECFEEMGVFSSDGHVVELSERRAV